MSNPLKNVLYGEVREDSSYKCILNFSFAQIIERAKVAIEENKMWVIHEINPQMLLEKEGFQILESRQLLYFHPRYMTRLLELDPSAVIEVPLKVVVLQLSNGSTYIETTNAQEKLSRFPKLSQLSTELNEISKNIFHSISKAKRILDNNVKQQNKENL